MNSRQKKLILVMPLIIYSMAIFILSALPQPEFIDLGFQYWDKILHLKAYFVYGVFTITAIVALKPELLKMKIMVLAVIIGFLFGLSDEIHQYFVPGRDADVWDLAADTAGILISLTTISIIRTFTARIRTI